MHIFEKRRSAGGGNKSKGLEAGVCVEDSVCLWWTEKGGE